MQKIILIDQAVSPQEWCEYVQVFGWIYGGCITKTAILLFVGFLKIQNSQASSVLFSKIVDQMVSPGKIWRNP